MPPHSCRHRARNAMISRRREPKQLRASRERRGLSIGAASEIHALLFPSAIPAKAGIQDNSFRVAALDPGFRRGDANGVGGPRLSSLSSPGSTGRSSNPCARAPTKAGGYWMPLSRARQRVRCAGHTKQRTPKLLARRAASELRKGMRGAPEGRDPARAQGVLMGAPRAAIFKPRTSQRRTKPQRRGQGPPRPDHVTPAVGAGPALSCRPALVPRLPRAPHPCPT